MTFNFLSNETIKNLENSSKQFLESKPFNHIIIDNFFNEDVANKLSNDFLSFDSKDWFEYDNNLELKKIHNLWNLFPPLTYKVFSYLNSLEFIELLKLGTGIKSLYCDMGLHGGGCHVHARGGKLNVHKDYSIHPKMGLLRKVNIIIYLTKNWNPDWGGGLELWDDDNGNPGNKIKYVDCIFNRAVIFDTTQNSWHGLPEPITCPENEYRKSLAIYYLTEPTQEADPRQKALYAPYKEQKDNPEILKMIKERASDSNYSNTYRKKI